MTIWKYVRQFPILKLRVLHCPAAIIVCQSKWYLHCIWSQHKASFNIKFVPRSTTYLSFFIEKNQFSSTVAYKWNSWFHLHCVYWSVSSEEKKVLLSGSSIQFSTFVTQLFPWNTVLKSYIYLQEAMVMCDILELFQTLRQVLLIFILCLSATLFLVSLISL